MLKVRLQRVGRRNDPSFRMVVIESTKGPKSRNYIEMLGSYNPRLKQTTVDGERVKHWIAQGAQVSDTVHNILVNEKVIDAKKVNPLGKKTPIVKDSEDSDAPAEVPPAETSVKEDTSNTEEASAQEATKTPTDDAPIEKKTSAQSEEKKSVSSEGESKEEEESTKEAPAEKEKKAQEKAPEETEAEPPTQKETDEGATKNDKKEEVV